MSLNNTPILNDEELDFVYKRDGFTIPIRAVYESLTPMQKECLTAWTNALIHQRELEARTDELTLVTKDFRDANGQIIESMLEDRLAQLTQNNTKQSKGLCMQSTKGQDDA
jgi:hypothetical protein